MAIELVSFDVNQTEFSSKRSKEIWYLGKHILPLDISLADITDIELREGCTQLYQFTRELYSDMCRHPEQYPFLHVCLIFDRFIKYGAVMESGYNWILPCDVYNKYVRNHDGNFEILVSLSKITR